MYIKRIFVSSFCWLLLLSVTYSQLPIHAPIYADPVYCGSCDPEIIYNSKLKLWMIFYTARRPAKGMAATVGNPIGVCISDNLTDWSFVGIVDLMVRGVSRIRSRPVGLPES